MPRMEYIFKSLSCTYKIKTQNEKPPVLKPAVESRKWEEYVHLQENKN